MGTTHATYDDVNLVLHLYETRREERMRQARAWFASSFKAKSFDEYNTLCAPGTDQNANFRMVTSYWEMVASFLTAGVLNQQLFFQSGRELLFVWERIRDLLPTVRAKNSDPAYLKNLETVAGAYIEWMQVNSPGAYEAFSKRVRGL
ncbi:MAG: hypothetical protein KGN76_15275 [Acidobacteriota bacterium]|nr:hypothetical protein [Acidobacteriota bacterium]